MHPGSATRGRDLPVLMLSALDETADRTAGPQAGGDDHLVKPFARGQDVVPHGRRREAGELTRARRRLPAVPAAVLLVTLMAGCAHQDGASPDTTPTGTPSGYADMRKKVDAAESAAAAADRDARSTADR
ncbi:hypothetical protein ACFV2Z_05290 [Streptomyces sp. NPDC059688]|uniref:hypothetical protein n=1 Tax=Streptomyces sp. NPDC059688 TaxID=3346906 RepID=UPI0036AACA77